MKNSKNLKLAFELLEAIENINTLIANQDRQMAVAHFHSLEKRIQVIQSVHPKTHILNKIIDKIYSLHVSELYEELEQDLELYKKDGFILKVGGNDE